MIQLMASLTHYIRIKSTLIVIYMFSYRDYIQYMVNVTIYM
jgi:hypothetical protein